MTRIAGDQAVQRARGSRYKIFVTVASISIAVVVIALGVNYEMQRPSQIEGQECIMPDGTVLRLHKVTYGKVHQFELERRHSTWSLFHFARNMSTTNASTPEDSIVFWLTRHDASGRVLDFDWWSHCRAINDEGYEMMDDLPGRDIFYTSG